VKFHNIAKFAVVAVAAPLALIIQGPAQAAISDCPSGRFCGWDTTTFSGSWAYFATGSADLRNPIGGVVFDNRFSSLYNNDNAVWCVYKGYSYTGSFVEIAPGTGGSLTSSHGPGAGAFNDQISSLRVRPAGGC
jgi:hypothetical protein